MASFRLGPLLSVAAIAVAAAALAGPSVLPSRGEPMLVASEQDWLQPAVFDGSDCAAQLVDGEIRGVERRLIAVLQGAGEDVTLTMRAIRPNGSAAEGSVVLVLEAAGRIVSVVEVETNSDEAAATLGCDTRPPPGAPGSV